MRGRKRRRTRAPSDRGLEGRLVIVNDDKQSLSKSNSGNVSAQGDKQLNSAHVDDYITSLKFVDLVGSCCALCASVEQDRCIPSAYFMMHACIRKISDGLVGRLLLELKRMPK